MTTEGAGAEVGARLEKQTEAALWRAFKTGGSAKAREELFEMHLPFAKQLAKRHYYDRESGDIELPELRQLACVGLLEAIDRYDPEKGALFQTYARRRIAGSIMDGVSKLNEMREQMSFRKRLQNERMRSLSNLKAEKAPLAEAMQALVDLAVGLATGFMLEGTGLYVSEDEADHRNDAYESAAWKDAIRKLTSEMEKLPERERTVIRRHYLDGLDFEQIGRLLGVSKGRVSQIHRAALALLRRRLERTRAFRLEK